MDDLVDRADLGKEPADRLPQLLGLDRHAFGLVQLHVGRHGTRLQGIGSLVDDHADASVSVVILCYWGKTTLYPPSPVMTLPVMERDPSPGRNRKSEEHREGNM